MSTSISAMGLFVIIGAVILAGTLLVGGAVALARLLRRSPARTDEPANGGAQDATGKSARR